MKPSGRAQPDRALSRSPIAPAGYPARVVKIAVCFVCLGNICRSPTAEGLFQQLVDEAGLSDHIEVDSAGTGAYHVGERADGRSRETARSRGVELRSRARQFEAQDLERFDYVVAMDRDNLAELVELADDAAARQRISLMRSFGEDGASLDVPDPYYGGPGGFDRVFDICDAACRALLAEICERHDLER